MPKILYTTPEFDDITFYFREWSKEVIGQTGGSWRSYQLDKERVTRKNFDSMLSNDPHFVFLNGHGDPDVVYGHKSDDVPELILVSDDNDNLMKNRVVYARTCYSLKSLGKKCVEKGAKAFIGYNKKFTIVIDPHEYHSPSTNRLARPFKDISNIIPLTIIKGGTVQEALNRSFRDFKRSVEYLETHYTPEKATIMHFLVWDMKALGAFGDPDARIT